MKSVESVVNSDYCISCGACRPVCPQNAISYKFQGGIFVPVIDNHICSDCGLCRKVCPSAAVDASSVYGSWQGNINVRCYSAYIYDKTKRLLSTSGGIVSGIVSFLLDSNIYDTAYLLEYDNFNGPAELKCYNNTSQINNTFKSKYIPASIEKVVNDIKNKNISKSIIVCTPCQLLAIKRALDLYHITRKNLLFIGLFCENTLNYNIYNYYKYKYGNYDILHFKDKTAGGWPGNTKIFSSNKNVVIDKSVRMNLKQFFQLNRCRYCFDKLNMLADISVGDCYVKGEETVEGKSSVIVRTQLGEFIWNECSSVLFSENASLSDILLSQNIDGKKVNLFRNVNGGVYKNVEKIVDSEIPLSNTNSENGYKMLQLGKYVSNRFGYFLFLIRKKMMFSARIKRLHQIQERLARFVSFQDCNYYIYIDNDGYENCGDQMMIDAIVTEISKRKPYARIVVSYSFWSKAMNYCSSKCLLPLQIKSSGFIQSFNRFIYRHLLGCNDYITPRQIDLVLNAKGYAYSDKWNPDQWRIEKDRTFYSKFNKKNRRIILMPQAFGPFDTEMSRMQIRQMYDLAEQVYPRDSKSFQYVAKAVGEKEKLYQVPDFTSSSYPTNYPNIQFPIKQYIVVILNARMIDKTKDSESDKYMDFFLSIISILVSKKENVIMLNHEGLGDETLMRQINEKLETPVPLISNIDASNVKAIIRDAKLVISSRYHGVVSALSQNVPALCTSWSHKYQELLFDCGCCDGVLDVLNLDDSMRKIDDALTNPTKYMAQEKCVSILSSKVKEMWSRVL